ncbi:lipid-A-disaccharide synthase N-terminal domain-containing protein [Palleronia sp. LCG004]|uniref:lipid-A-disaccharide synthase N-terminal domain-containing protein n=1 Tax=Palleronia sp. LCG004 TaxID=3079304 RepID=UPI002943A43C|nr:lipid-A-disaccharide synthase N-terminal domain-containing protein [Palleronia sp. LCG004]WOI55717.1 lipid-A-disaccharide synthase N-terminal domain-containing protein [Palleronia sp. LCG004]
MSGLTTSASNWPDLAWLIFGLLGQCLFAGRFVVQWLASERARRSVLPNIFWYFSIGGGLCLLVYAVHRSDPVFVLGQALGLFIYARNLWFVWSEKRNGRSSAQDPCPTAAETGRDPVEEELLAGRHPA